MGFSSDQISNGQTIIDVVKSMGLSPQDTSDAELDAIMAALDESGMRNIDYGDYPPSMGGQMSSSRGLFQQIAAWGPLSAREDPVQATRMFLTGGQEGQSGLLDIKGWDSMNPWTADQAVQQSEFADGSNYKAQMDTAQEFLAQYGNSAGQLPPATGVGSGADASNGSGSSSGGDTPYSGLEPSPGSQLLGAAASGIWGEVGPFLVESLFVVAGLAMVMIGIWRMSQPARRKVETAAADTAPLAAMA